LTGDGDVSRYLAPGVALDAVTPAPFTKVTVDRLAVAKIDGSTRARVLATATTSAGGQRSVGYELGIHPRAGRWAVTSLAGAAVLADQPATPASTAPTAPAPTAPAPTAPPTSPSPEDGSSTPTTYASAPGA